MASACSCRTNAFRIFVRSVTQVHFPNETLAKTPWHEIRWQAHRHTPTAWSGIANLRYSTAHTSTESDTPAQDGDARSSAEATATASASVSASASAEVEERQPNDTDSPNLQDAQHEPGDDDATAAPKHKKLLKLKKAALRAAIRAERKAAAEAAGEDGAEVDGDGLFELPRAQRARQKELGPDKLFAVPKAQDYLLIPKPVNPRAGPSVKPGPRVDKSKSKNARKRERRAAEAAEAAGGPSAATAQPSDQPSDHSLVRPLDRPLDKFSDQFSDHPSDHPLRHPTAASDETIDIPEEEEFSLEEVSIAEVRKAKRRSEKEIERRMQKKFDKVRREQEEAKERDERERERWRNLPMWAKQKETLKKKFPEGWRPHKRLSPDALNGIRALNQQFPEMFTTKVLSERFEVSPEAIRRILRTKWVPKAEEDLDRQRRWHNRGVSIWKKYEELGKKPPRKWREAAIINKDPTRRGPQLDEDDWEQDHWVEEPDKVEPEKKRRLQVQRNLAANLL